MGEPDGEPRAIRDAIEQCQSDLNAIQEALAVSPHDAELLQARGQLQESLAALLATQKPGVRVENPAGQPAATRSEARESLHRLRTHASGNNARIHPRSKYAAHEPDFAALAEEYPYLKPFLRKGRRRPTLDFGDRDACVALTRALLAADYGVEWTLPPGHLVPPLTGRANYLHWLEDLLVLSCPAGARAGGAAVRGLDIGTGASLVYPLLGAADRGWSFVGVDVVPTALHAAADLLLANPRLGPLIELRLAPPQPEQKALVFGGGAAGVESASGKGGGDGEGVGRCVDHARVDGTSTTTRGQSLGILSAALRPNDPPFAFSMCNPPFFEALEEAGLNPRTAYGGTAAEMVFPGGEAAFVRAMARDSACLRARVHWFSTMVGKKSTLRALRATLGMLRAPVVRTTEFCQGATSRWAVAWSWQAAAEVGRMALPRGTLLRASGGGASMDGADEKGGTLPACAATSRGAALPPGFRWRYMTEVQVATPAELLRRLEAAAGAVGASSVQVDSGRYLVTADLPLTEGSSAAQPDARQDSQADGTVGQRIEEPTAKRTRTAGDGRVPQQGDPHSGSDLNHCAVGVSLQAFQVRPGVMGVEVALQAREDTGLSVFRSFVERVWGLVRQPDGGVDAGAC